MTNRTRRSLAQWQHLVDQQANSDLNAAAFCRLEGLCSKSFYHYRKMFNNTSTQLVTGRFIQVKAKPVPTAAMVVLDYRQVRLQLSTNIDPVWVADLMKALS